MANVVGVLDDDTLVAHDGMTAPSPGTGEYVDVQLDNVNRHLKSVSAPTIDKTDLLDASRYAAGDGGTIDREAFIARLDANTRLSRPEAEAVLTKLGDNAPDVIIAAHQLAIHREHAAEKAETTGNALLAAGVGLFLCLVTAMAGAIIGARRSGRQFDRPNTIPGHPAATIEADRVDAPME
jgi:hypothetical protein